MDIIGDFSKQDPTCIKLWSLISSTSQYVESIDNSLAYSQLSHVPNFLTGNLLQFGCGQFIEMDETFSD